MNSSSIIRAVITPDTMRADARAVMEAAASHQSYPAHIATVTDIATRRVIA